MTRTVTSWLVLVAVLLGGLSSVARAQPKTKDAPEAKKPAAPKEFAFVLSNGYGEGDHFSDNPNVFENLVWSK